MAIFKKSNDKKDKRSIAELESYYANQGKRSNSTARAWIMAILAVLLTILFLSLAWLAGSWIYQKISDKDSSKTVETTVSDDQQVANNNEGQVDEGAANTEESNADRVEQNSEQDDQENTETEGQEENDADQEDENSSSNNGTNGSTGSGKDDGSVPNTGPGETVLAISAVAGLAGYALERKRQQLKNNA